MPEKLQQVLARSRQLIPVGCLAVFFLFFLIFGVVAGWFGLVSPVLESLAARNWKETPCTIISSFVQHGGGKGGGSYSVDIKYRYEFDDAPFASDRYGFFQQSSSDPSSKQRIVDRFPAGKRCACWVDPRDPRRAVLERGFTSEAWLGLLGPLFAFIGAGGLYWAPVLAPRPRKRALTAGERMASTGTSIVPKANPDGTVTLAPRIPRRGKVIVSGIMAIAINAFVAFGFIAIRAKGMDWGGALFSILLVLAGISSIVLPIRAILQLLNPRVVLVLGTGILRPGTIVRLAWRAEGRSWPRRLRVMFVGREVATWAGENSSVTKEERFHESVILDVRDPAVLERGGRLEIRIPLGSMHSFEAKHNKIEWLITVNGEIPLWPDMKDEYLLNVLPAEVARG
jgi:hypothetical protein